MCMDLSYRHYILDREPRLFYIAEYPMSTVYIQPALLSVIKKYAEKENRSTSNYISNIVMKHIEKETVDNKNNEVKAA